MLEFVLKLGQDWSIQLGMKKMIKDVSKIKENVLYFLPINHFCQTFERFFIY